MERNKKPQQIAAKTKLQTPRVPRLKQPPRDLAEWIKLANLVESGKELPELFEPGDQFRLVTTETWTEMLQRIARWDDPLRSYMLDHTEAPENWREIMADSIDRGKENFAPEYYRDALCLKLAMSHYKKIEIAQFLRLLTQSGSDQALTEFESLVSSLRYAELSYLRQCEYCGNIFYAGRTQQPGCTPEHSSNIRKKNKRIRDKNNRTLKKKRASKARQRR